MPEEHELPSDSDEDDEDYIPGTADSEPGSEAESEGEAESGPEDENDENKKVSGKGRGKKRSKGSRGKSKKPRKKAQEKSVVEVEEEKQESEEKKLLTEEEEKKKADSLWADFMKDTAVVSKRKPESSTNGPTETSSSAKKPKVEEKVKVTEVYEFAGEEVKIEKEVPANSTEARLALPEKEITTNKVNFLPVAGRGTSRGSSGTCRAGISSILGQLGRKTKISTLEKSKLDWDNFKKQENLEDEISTHNKGKDGYLERQDFLQRADLRQFEIEKQLRNSSRRSTR